MIKEKVVGTTFQNIDITKLPFKQKERIITLPHDDGEVIDYYGIPTCVVSGWIYPESTNRFDKNAKLVEVFTDEGKTTMPIGYLSKTGELYQKLKDITTPLKCKIKAEKYDTINLHNSYSVIID